jgi:hypothetical protein
MHRIRDRSGNYQGMGIPHDEVAAKCNDFDLARNLSEAAQVSFNRTETTKS